MLKHRIFYEAKKGIKLKIHDILHHIDCNPYNNNIENLWLTNSNRHGKAHRSMRLIRIELVEYPYAIISIESFREYLKKEIIEFDRNLGIYFIT